MTKREEQRVARRDAILDAALELFLRKGFSATKITDIAQAADMSTGLLFHYFDSKEKLYETLISMGISAPRAMLEGLDASDPLQYFYNASKQMFTYIKNIPFVAKMFVLMDNANMSDATPDSVRRLLKKVDFYNTSIPVIKAGQAAGVIRAGDPMALAVAFWSAIQGIARVIALKPKTPCPESSWVVDMLRQ